MSNELITTENGGSASDVQAGGSSETSQIVASTPSTGRKAMIEEVMRTDIDRYDREFHDEYRAILESELQAANPDTIFNSPTEFMHPDNSRNAFLATEDGAQLVQDWDSMGGFKVQLQNAQKTARSIVNNLGDARHQKVFLERFNASLPEPVQHAIYRDIATGRPGYAPEASEAEVQRFSSTPHGAGLVEEWGSSAAHNVGLLSRRLERFLETITESEERQFWNWFDKHDPETVKTFVRGLV